MKILACITILFWLLTLAAYHAAEHAPSDDFGLGALVWLLGLLAAGMTFALFVWMLL